MDIACAATSLPTIHRLRDVYRHEMHCQIIHDSLHERPGWTTPYLLTVDASPAGYGAVAHAGPWKDKPTIFEFYVLPQQRHRMFRLFSALVAACGTRAIETQTNSPFLGVLIQTLCPSVAAEAVLYEDRMTTSITIPGAVFRPVAPADAEIIAARKLDGGAGWLVELAGDVTGTGGILYHYNRPYGDLFMEIAEPFRRRGLGAFIVQELKRTCYEGGSIPAARCNVNNLASRLTLQKAGFAPCGNLVTGTIPESAAL